MKPQLGPTSLDPKSVLEYLEDASEVAMRDAGLSFMHDPSVWKIRHPWRLMGVDKQPFSKHYMTQIQKMVPPQVEDAEAEQQQQQTDHISSPPVFLGVPPDRNPLSDYYERMRYRALSLNPLQRINLPDDFDATELILKKYLSREWGLLSDYRLDAVETTPDISNHLVKLDIYPFTSRPTGDAFFRSNCTSLLIKGSCKLRLIAPVLFSLKMEYEDVTIKLFDVHSSRLEVDDNDDPNVATAFRLLTRYLTLGNHLFKIVFSSSEPIPSDRDLPDLSLYNTVSRLQNCDACSLKPAVYQIDECLCLPLSPFFLCDICAPEMLRLGAVIVSESSHTKVAREIIPQDPEFAQVSIIQMLEAEELHGSTSSPASLTGGDSSS